MSPPSRRQTLQVLLAGALLGPSLARGGASPLLVILYFENAGNPELDMLKIGLAQMLITDLSSEPGIQVVERERLQAVLDEQKLQRSDVADASTAVKVGALLGAGRLILGSYFELVGVLRIDARVVEVETSLILTSTSVQGPRETVLVLERELAGKLSAFLGTPPPPPSPGKKSEDREGTRVPSRGMDSSTTAKEAPQDRNQRTSPPRMSGGSGGSTSLARPLEAALAFSVGLEFLDRKDVIQAREALSRALDLDPSLEDARAMLLTLPR